MKSVRPPVSAAADADAHGLVAVRRRGDHERARGAISAGRCSATTITSARCRPKGGDPTQDLSPRARRQERRAARQHDRRAVRPRHPLQADLPEAATSMRRPLPSKPRSSTPSTRDAALAASHFAADFRRRRSPSGARETLYYCASCSARRSRRARARLTAGLTHALAQLVKLWRSSTAIATSSAARAPTARSRSPTRVPARPAAEPLPGPQRDRFGRLPSNRF